MPRPAIACRAALARGVTSPLNSVLPRVFLRPTWPRPVAFGLPRGGAGAAGGADAEPGAFSGNAGWGLRAELWVEKRRNREEKRNKPLYDKRDWRGGDWRREQELGEDQRQALRKIRQLGKERRWQEALQVLSEAEDPKPALWTAAMKACATALEMDRVQAIFDEMPEKTVAAYNVLVWTFGLRDPACAEQLVEEMPERGLRPDAGIYRSLIDSHGRASSLPDALRVFARAQAEGFPPSTATYQVLLSACARAGDPARAEQTIEEMRKTAVEPDVGHWSSLISACSRSKDEVRARQSFDGMRRAALEPDGVAYTALMSCFGGERAVQRGRATLAEMRAAAVLPDTFAYNAVLGIAAEAGDEASFAELLAELDGEGLQRNRETWLRQSRLEQAVARMQQSSEVAASAVAGAPLPPGWDQATDPASGAQYYWRTSDPAATTTWERPHA